MEQYINKLITKGWAFNCPYHGLELGAFCFRAFDEQFKIHWIKTALIEIDYSEDELDDYFNSIKLH